MDLEVRHLQLVAAVADVGSLTRAGDRLHLTQSALSHQLRDIEERLGAALFLRHRQASGADAGRRAPARIGARHSGPAAADRRRHPPSRATSAPACCGSPPSARPAITGCRRCSTTYRRRFPSVEVRIDVEATSRPVQAPARRHHRSRADEHAGPRSAARGRARSSPIRSSSSSSPQHRLAARRRVALTDLHDETVLIYPPRQESLFLQQVLLPAGVVPARIEEVKLTEAIIEMVKANLGISALARWAVQPFLDSGAVVALPHPAARPPAALVGRDAEGPRDGRLRGGVHRSARARRSGDWRAEAGDAGYRGAAAAACCGAAR